MQILHSQVNRDQTQLGEFYETQLVASDAYFSCPMGIMESNEAEHVAILKAFELSMKYPDLGCQYG